MTRRLLVTVAGCVVAAASACVLPYKFPTADQPHATMKVRRVYERTAGVKLEESCLIESRSALHDDVAVELAGTPRSDGFLVRPGPARMVLGSRFHHTEVRSVQESYTEQVPYTTMETYQCGFGTSAQTCTRMATHYRSETRYRWVTKAVDVDDGACTQKLRLMAEIDHVYLVDFTYRDNGVCDAICVEQAGAGSDGGFENRPCPVEQAAN